jgi:uncharacterized protein YjbJ (UPF0337 family)
MFRADYGRPGPGIPISKKDKQTRECNMSATDKIKNAIEDVEGKAKEALGKATGDKSTENEGKGDQAKSDLKNAGENVKDAFKH